jgi:hypothetical protein
LKIKEALFIANKTSFLYTMDSQRSFCKAVGKGIDEDFKNIPCLDGLLDLI